MQSVIPLNDFSQKSIQKETKDRVFFEYQNKSLRFLRGSSTISYSWVNTDFLRKNLASAARMTPLPSAPNLFSIKSPNDKTKTLYCTIEFYPLKNDNGMLLDYCFLPVTPLDESNTIALNSNIHTTLLSQNWETQLFQKSENIFSSPHQALQKNLVPYGFTLQQSNADHSLLIDNSGLIDGEVTFEAIKSVEATNQGIQLYRKSLSKILADNNRWKEQKHTFFPSGACTQYQLPGSQEAIQCFTSYSFEESAYRLTFLSTFPQNSIQKNEYEKFKIQQLDLWTKKKEKPNTIPGKT